MTEKAEHTLEFDLQVNKIADALAQPNGKAILVLRHGETNAAYDLAANGIEVPVNPIVKNLNPDLSVVKRKGKIKYGRMPNPLTEKGIEEAKSAGLIIKEISERIGHPVDKVISSPIKRALETALNAAQVIGDRYKGSNFFGNKIPLIETLGKVQEVEDNRTGLMHDWTDEHGQEFKQDPKIWNSQFLEGAEAFGESPEEVAERFELAVQEIIQNESPGFYVLVTHAGLIDLGRKKLAGKEAIPSSVSELIRTGGIVGLCVKEAKVEDIGELRVNDTNY